MISSKRVVFPLTFFCVSSCLARAVPLGTSMDASEVHELLTRDDMQPGYNLKDGLQSPAPLCNSTTADSPPLVTVGQSQLYFQAQGQELLTVLSPQYLQGRQIDTSKPPPKPLCQKVNENRHDNLTFVHNSICIANPLLVEGSSLTDRDPRYILLLPVVKKPSLLRCAPAGRNTSFLACPRYPA